MLVVLIRHGAYLTEGYSDDSLYPLSEEGKRSIDLLCKKLKGQNICPELLFTSPLKRAVDTAEIIGNLFSITMKIIDELNHFDKVVIKNLLEMNFPKTVFLVGHAPTLLDFAKDLCKDFQASDLKKGSGLVFDLQKYKTKFLQAL